MPIDKQPRGPTTKPITPALSSRFRNGKPPLAPRLAGSTAVSPAISTRRELREQTLSPLAEQHQSPSLSGNITPRSGARNTRISTESPTSPATRRRLSGTSSIQDALATTRRNLGATSPDKNGLAAKTNSPNISASRRASGSSSTSGKDEDSKKFFRANDTRPGGTKSSAKSAISPRPLSTAYLKVANPRTVNSAPPSAAHSDHGKEEDHFVRADELHIRAPRPQLRKKQSTTSMASTASMNTARTRSPNLSRTKSQPSIQAVTQLSPRRPAAMPASRPPSPQKQVAAPLLSSTLRQENPSDRRRSLSNSTPSPRPVQPLGHKKSSSINSLGVMGPKLVASPLLVTGHKPEPSWSPPTIAASVHPLNPSTSSPENPSPRSASLTSFQTVATSVTSDTDVSDVSKIALPPSICTPADPVSSSQTRQPNSASQAQVDANSARRERKVLDLEISNSSLLAINKTLEKELRKQSIELRRFRRLSRSGRLSFAPSNRSVSGQSAISLDTLQEQTEDDGEHSEEEDDESDLEDISDESDEQLALDDSLASSTARARRRARDERRLMLDLSKHQQLLIDSQKLTQSIRKCLNLTEELIKDGKQALEYKVGIGDIKLGGRVLSMDDYEVETGLDGSQKAVEPRQGLLSPSVATAELQTLGPWGSGDQDAIEPPPNGISESRDPG